YTPQELVNTRAKDFIEDSMDKEEYANVYKEEEETDELAEPEDEANVYRVTFPEVPFKDHSALEVQTLDRELAQLSVSPEKQVKSRGKRSAPQTFMTRNRQAKCVLVLENYAPSNERQQMSGPLITFALASIDRIIDADNSDLISFPFLKLVAPEHILHVTRYLENLSGSTDVKFERFMLLSRPRVIEGDIEVRDEDNLR
ncbi:hypothetical protein IWW56_006338, partial [Coemansia sp. RSA 2131]